MQLSDKTGVCCDLCGTSYRDDFTYYSYDFRLVEVYTNIRPSLDEMVSAQPVFSLDVCELCFAAHKKLVVAANSKAIPWLKRRPRPEVTCDLSGLVMSGTYNYYYNVVSKVIVRSDGNPSICCGCRTQTTTPNMACKKCGGTVFSKQIEAKIDKRFVEMVVSEDMYNKMVATAGSTRKNASEWSTKS